MNSDNIILCTEVHAPLVTKGAELTPNEVDLNFVNLYEDMQGKALAGGVSDYDSLQAYSLTDCANYDERTWTFVNASPAVGVQPGTDPDFWTEIDPTFLAHKKNTDTGLAEGTPNAVTAAGLKELYDARPLRFTGTIDKSVINSLSTSPQPVFTCAPGTGIQFFGASPLFRTFSDGVAFSSSSGENLAISSSAGIMAFVSDADIQGPDGPYSAFVANYAIVTGDIYLTASYAISGGGAAATIDYEVFYRVVTL